MGIVAISGGGRALVDDADLPLISQHTWCLHRAAGGRQYAATKAGTEYLYMHRLLLGAKPDESCDHINGDGLDNRRCNLRLASHSQNMANRKGWSSSGLKGVRRAGARWQAQITHNRRTVHLGRFDTKEAAARAYDAAARAAFGEFAILNFPLTER